MKAMDVPHTYNAWDIDEHDFPHDGSAEEKLMFCLRYAILAPSTYNTQPWIFEITEGSVFVFMDRRVGLAVIDPDDREITLACAAAIYNLRLAIRYFGYEERTYISPDTRNEDLLARIEIGGPIKNPLNARKREMFGSIMERHTNRGVFSKKNVDQTALKLMEHAATEEGAWFYVCEEHEKAVVADLIAEGDTIQMGKAFPPRAGVLGE